jgi:hypothetical protein
MPEVWLFSIFRRRRDFAVKRRAVTARPPEYKRAGLRSPLAGRLRTPYRLRLKGNVLAVQEINNQAPRYNGQTITNSQIPTSKQKEKIRLVIDYWLLEFVWSLPVNLLIAN